MSATPDLLALAAARANELHARVRDLGQQAAQCAAELRELADLVRAAPSDEQRVAIVALCGPTADAPTTQTEIDFTAAPELDAEHDPQPPRRIVYARPRSTE